jgi:hypothetical protein
LAAGCVWEKTQDEKRDAEDHRQGKVEPRQSPGLVDGLFHTAGKKRVR